MCAGAVLESPRLAMEVPADTRVPICPKMIPRHANIEPKVSRSGPKASPRHPNAVPGASKCAPRHPNGAPRRPKESPRLPKEKQKERNAGPKGRPGILYTQKLPINRTSGHYVIINVSIYAH